MQISPSRVELAARGQNDKKESAGREALFPSHTDWLYDGRVHERRESRYDSGYGATDCNGRAAQRLYTERHPVRRTPAHTMFSRLHQQICETGSFQKAARNRDRMARTELNEEIVLDMVETTPSLSTRGIANDIGISYSSIWRILDDSALHPFHYQRVHSLKECDFAPRQAFSQWYLQQRIANPFFAASVLFTDEASFSREGIFNTHNSYSWAAANPHVTRTRAAQDRFLVNV
ncbi:DUF4817 domain-containing protein [Trichonephila clavipes]|uniref:DUF4817 domain-containing protein n=1 Tax=Trichonephila clavipes TaxID=2585209 RepID=A0A8X6S7P3_TRICX|nr:DUF4817 domain-containing protein [Trichonephila clavipes]